MSNLLPRISFRRPDQPQPVYKGAVSLWEGHLYASIGNAQRNCGYRSADGPRLDVRGYEWTPESGWTFTSSAPTLTDAQKWPAILQALGPSYRSAEAKPFDVRQPWVPEPAWINSSVDAVVRGWAPMFGAERKGSERTGDTPRLDVRTQEWAPQFGWSGTAADRVTSTWIPAFLGELGGFRSPDAARLDVRAYDWSQFGWVRTPVDSNVQRWMPAVTAALASTRSPDKPALDVRLPEWQPESGWIFSSLAQLTVAQMWPALLQALGLSYRSLDKRILDVRSHEWAPEFGWVKGPVDLNVQRWMPAIAAELASARSAERPSVDVRRAEWSPESGWLFTSLAVLTAAQIWPAILQALGPSYRSLQRSSLDVLRHEWAPESGWVERVVEGQVSLWIPAFTTEAAPALNFSAGSAALGGNSPEAEWIIVTLSVGGSVVADAGSGATWIINVRRGTWNVEARETTWTAPARRTNWIKDR